HSGGGGCALRARLAQGGGFRPRCGGLPTGHRGPHGHRAAPPCSKANPDDPRGRGLVNDATALILFRFAVAAVATGTFSFANALGGFFAVVMGEAIYGVAVGWAMLQLRRWARDSDFEITLSLLTPYAAFWPPE